MLPVMTETTSTLDTPFEAPVCKLNEQISPNETAPRIVKAKFLKQSKATAQIWATSKVFYIVCNHSILVPLPLHTQTR